MARLKTVHAIQLIIVLMGLLGYFLIQTPALFFLDPIMPVLMIISLFATFTITMMWFVVLGFMKLKKVIGNAWGPLNPFFIIILLCFQILIVLDVNHAAPIDKQSFTLKRVFCEKYIKRTKHTYEIDNGYSCFKLIDDQNIERLTVKVKPEDLSFSMPSMDTNTFVDVGIKVSPVLKIKLFESNEMIKRS